MWTARHTKQEQGGGSGVVGAEEAMTGIRRRPPDGSDFHRAILNRKDVKACSWAV